jgi:hypothetical protein
MANAKPQLTEFPIGDYVLLHHPGERPEKMKTQPQGPYKVVKNDKSAFSIENLVDKKRVTVHITNLRPYYFDLAVIDPAIIAMHDNQEFVIEKVLNHS